jgi:hypothetical protein
MMAMMLEMVVEFVDFAGNFWTGIHWMMMIAESCEERWVSSHLYACTMRELI